ncbi:hypothetical protein PMIN01_09791 [Paraphaeosphaeria minitans]|uniref:Uncharacterized protein n=1 Tax=Paraphaeosphaeria minitans TaxID=565426 RepID=A0A9P6GAE1_9PLEO|nr:hypothetical protein PMIN01_09791 [Paraphaeosphaeria minitans]
MGALALYDGIRGLRAGRLLEADTAPKLKKAHTTKTARVEIQPTNVAETNSPSVVFHRTACNDQSTALQANQYKIHSCSTTRPTEGETAGTHASVASRGDETNRERDNKQSSRVEAAVGTTRRLMSAAVKDPRASGNYSMVIESLEAARDGGDGVRLGALASWRENVGPACELDSLPASQLEGRRTWVVTVVLPAAYYLYTIYTTCPTLKSPHFAHGPAYHSDRFPRQTRLQLPVI